MIGPGHQLLTTRLGDIDCLGTIDGERTFDDLIAEATTLELGDGLRCRALSLEQLIGIKERAGRPKDLAALPVLRATLEERRRSPETDQE